MRVFSALVFLLAAPVAAQQVSPYPLIVPPGSLVPRLNGLGFGSALSTSPAQVAEGNPGALPAARGGALVVRADTPDDTSPLEIMDENGDPLPIESQRRMAAAPLPANVGAVWTSGRLRMGLGYARPMDYQGDWSASQTAARSTNTMHQVAASLAAAWTIPGAGVLVSGARVKGIRYNETSRWDDDVHTTRSDARLNGIGWAVGATLEPMAVPVHLGVFYEGRTSLDGEVEGLCVVPENATCSVPNGTYDATADLPARLEASVGGRVAAFSWDATAARVFWGDLNVNDLGVYANTWEGHANLRYRVLPRWSATLGFSQNDRTPYKKGTVVSVYGDDATRLLLLGATYERGPLVLDAAYVNGTLLSDDGRNTHLGSLGVGYRF